VSATHATDVVVTVAVAVTMTMSPVIIVMMMVVVMIIIWMIPEWAIPTPMETIPVIGTIPVIVIVPRVVISVIVWIVVSIIAGIEPPVPRVAYIDIGGVATGVVIVIIVERGAGSRTKTLDARSEVGIVIGFGSGVNNAVGVSYRLGVLVHGFGIRNIIFTIGIIGLIIVSGIAADARRYGTIGLMPARRVVRRIIGVVISHPLV